jgi:hypothetical protein
MAVAPWGITVAQHHNLVAFGEIPEIRASMINTLGQGATFLERTAPARMVTGGL